MRQLDPKAVWLFFVSLILQWFIVLGIFGLWLIIWIGTAIGNNLSIERLLINLTVWVLIIIFVLLIFFWIWAKLAYHFYRYELTESGFRKELGVIWKKYVTIPYDRIQNVDIYRGVWARILGLSDLNIQTAGASATVGRYGAIGIGAEGRLPGLSRETAEKLRDELIRRARLPIGAARQSENRGL